MKNLYFKLEVENITQKCFLMLRQCFLNRYSDKTFFCHKKFFIAVRKRKEILAEGFLVASQKCKKKKVLSLCQKDIFLATEIIIKHF